MSTAQEFWKSYSSMVAGLLMSLSPRVRDGIDKFYGEGNPLYVWMTDHEYASVKAVNKQLPPELDVLLMVTNLTLGIMDYRATDYDVGPTSNGGYLATFAYEKIE